VVNCWIVKYDEILDEAFVVYWVVKYDEIWMKLLVVHWVVKYDEIWMKLLVVHWVVKYDEIWMIGAMIFQPYIHQATTQVWTFGSQTLGEGVVLSFVGQPLAHPGILPIQPPCNESLKDEG
jgi:hypothetical protein